MMISKIEKLLLSDQRVFSTQDLSVFWGMNNDESLYSLIKYYVKIGKLQREYKGIYSVGKFTSFELGQKLLVPSYISFYSALATHGLIYQYYDAFHFIALKSKKIQVNERIFSYHQVKEEIFYNQLGIIDYKTYQLASAERAICDSLYLAPNLAFDSLAGVNFDKLLDIAQIYKNKRLLREIEELIASNG